ncbi:MAG TPA: FAD-dependent oxidoreductase [Acidimicrobiales bacterium]
MSSLFDEIAVGTRVLRNRFVMTPHGGRIPPHRYVRYLEERVRDGGVALVITPVGESIYGHRSYPLGIGRLPEGWQNDLDAVLPDQGTPEGKRHFDRMLPVFAEQAAVVHRHGAMIFGQLHHATAERAVDNLQPTVAPSVRRGELPVQIPHALDTDEVRLMIRNYVAAGRRAIEAGMDGVELHSAHGYLMHRFLSPRYNTRTDAYGGDAARRRRAHVEILTALREIGGDDLVLGVRLPGPEPVEGGLTMDDVVEAAVALEPYVDYVSVSRGVHFGVLDSRDALSYTAPALVGGPPSLDVARAVRAAVQVPVVVTGRITTVEDAARIVDEGIANLVGMARAHIAEPHFVAKAREGRAAEITPCIGCNECTDTPFRCSVNPAAGREAELDPIVASDARHVVVVGGGPAGMEAAWRAAANGNRVTLLERRERLGGAVRVLGADPNRVAWSRYADVLEARVRANGVEVRTGVDADVATVADLSPDHVVVATGAAPWPAPFEVDGTRVLTSLDVPTLDERLGDHVLVVAERDDHLDAPMTALRLSQLGMRVTVTTEDLILGRGIEPRTLHLLTATLARAGVTTLTMTRVTAVRAGTADVEHVFTREVTKILQVDAVVLAHGRSPADELAHALRDAGIAATLVGDALAPRRLVHATLDGARLGANL